jgi:glycosyltransferase involved in cell wall biosynthesis/SAM-dependent methyltransferase
MTAADHAYFEQEQLWGRAVQPYQVQVKHDLLDLLPGDVQTVLDAGCGDGYQAAALAERGLRVFGLDFSVAALRRTAVPAAAADLTMLPLADDAVDLVICNDVLEHVPDDRWGPVLDELRRVSRRWVLISTPHAEQLAGGRACCADCGRAYHVNGHVRSFTAADMLGLLGEGWPLRSLRLSGGLTRTPRDALIGLRQRMGVWSRWEGGRCPDCGSGRQVQPGTELVETVVNSARARSWIEFWDQHGAHAERSELMALFECGGVGEIPDASPPGRGSASASGEVPDGSLRSASASSESDAEPGSRGVIDFSNPLQVTDEHLAGRSWAYAIAPLRATVEGGTVGSDSEAAVIIELRLPVAPHKGDRIALWLTGGGGEQGAALLASVDGVNRRRRALLSVDGQAKGRRDVEVPGSWQPDAYGLALELTLRGGQRVSRVAYFPAEPERAERLNTPMLTVEPGHVTLPMGEVGGAPLSWGFTSDVAGRMPWPTSTVAVEHEPAVGTASDPVMVEDQAAAPGVVVASTTDAEALVRTLGPTSEAGGVAELPPAPVRPVGPPRVLVFSHMFPHPDTPGSGPFIWEQVAALRKHAGIDARVISGRPMWMPKPYRALRWRDMNRDYHQQHFRTQQFADYQGVPVMWVPYRVAGGYPLAGMWYGKSMMAAAQRVRRYFPFDMVHAHTAYLDGSAGRAVAAAFDVPLMITEHTGPFTLLTRRRSVRKQTLAALQSAKKVFAVSGALQRIMHEQLPELAQGSIEVLPNSVDTARFHPPVMRRPDPQAPRLLWAGFFTVNKNVELLLEAVARLAAEMPGLTLVLVGKGETPADEQRLRQHAEALGVADRVRWLGYMDRPDLAAVMRNDADLLVLTSRTETFGVVLIEALATGMPVVATDCGGPADVVRDPVAGRLTPVDDPRALTDAIREQVAALPGADPRAIRRYAIERFAHERVAQRLAAAYRELAPQPG